jgi:hypothetical protein
MGRMARNVAVANPGADDAELLARVRLAHELMYFSRGNPVVYYGDEQGFVGDGGDQDARQDMFPSQVASYNDDDLIGTDATTAEANFDDGHPLYESIAELAGLRRRFRPLRTGAHQHRVSSDAPGIYAFSRLHRVGRREFVVALNNSEQTQTATVPTYAGNAGFRLVYGNGPDRLTTDAAGSLGVAVEPLSAVVYRAVRRLPLASVAPSVSLADPGALPARAEIRADAGGGFAEVSFLARIGDGGWSDIGTDDTAPYRLFHDTADIEPGTTVRYRAVVRDLAGNTRRSAIVSSTVAPPALALEAPAEGARVRGEVVVRAVASPDDPRDAVVFQRQVGDGDWADIGTDTSSPVYTTFDDTSGLADGTVVRYWSTRPGGPSSATRAACRSSPRP